MVLVVYGVWVKSGRENSGMLRLKTDHAIYSLVIIVAELHAPAPPPPKKKMLII